MDYLDKQYTEQKHQKHIIMHDDKVKHKLGVDTELDNLEKYLASGLDRQDEIRNFHVVLVSLYSFSSFALHILGPLLKSKGFKVSYIFFKDYIMDNQDLPTEEEYSLLMNLLADLKPNLIGLNVYSTYAPVAREVTKRAKTFGVPILWGGSHARDAADDSIKTADIVCSNEGEFPILKLAHALATKQNYHDIKSLWFNDNGKTIKNDMYPLLQNLDLLPLPEFDDDDKYAIEYNQLTYGEPYYNSDLSWYNFMTGRGCPYKCTFCSNSHLNRKYKGLGSILRRRTVDNVIEELSMVKSRFPKLSCVSANDEVFVLQRDWLVEFCEKYKKEINIPFHCDIYPTRITEDSMSLLHSMNTRTVSLGIQSGSERVRRDVYKRKTSDELLVNAANIIKKYNIYPSYDFIFDNPFEEEEDLVASLNFIAKMPRPFRINTYSMQNHPSTDLTKRMLSEGIISERDLDGYSLKGFDNWHIDLKHYDKASQFYHMYALFKIYSFSFAIIMPYFNRRYSVYPSWFLRFLIKNRLTLKKYTIFLTILLFFGKNADLLGRFLSMVLCGKWKRIYRKIFNEMKVKKYSIENNQVPCPK